MGLNAITVFFRDGGMFMYIILAVFLIGMAIMLERSFFLIYSYNINAKALWKRVSKFISDDNMDKAKALCDGSKIPLLRILHAGILVSDKTDSMIERAIDEITVEIIPDIEKRIAYLATLANVATLLGLLGTINGLVQSFKAVGSADPSQKATLLANGIALALNTTSFGLISAIPLLVMYTVLQSRANSLVDEIDEFSLKCVNILHRRKSVKEEG